MRALPTAEQTSAVITRVELDVKQALIEQARRHGRSLSGEVRQLLRDGLERDDDEPREAA